MPAPLYIDDEQLRSLHAQGLSNAQIANRLGVSQPTISKRLRRMGLTSNYYQPVEATEEQPTPAVRRPPLVVAPKPKRNRTASIKPSGQTDAAALRAWRIGLIQSAWRRVVARQMAAD